MDSKVRVQQCMGSKVKVQQCTGSKVKVQQCTGSEVKVQQYEICDLNFELVQYSEDVIIFFLTVVTLYLSL